MTKLALDPQKLVIFTNAILLALGALVNFMSLPGKDLYMSAFFTVWVATFAWYVISKRRSLAQ